MQRCLNFVGGLYFFLIFLSSQTLFAAPVLKLIGTTTIDHNVTINSGAIATISGKDVTLSQKTYAVVTKYIITELYLGQFYIYPGRGWDKSIKNPLQILQSPKLKAVAVTLHFLRRVTINELLTAFRGDLRNNNVSEALIDDYLNKKVYSTGGINASDGSQYITILGERPDNGPEVVRYENSETGKQVEIKGQDVIKNIFSVWLGNVKDIGLIPFKQKIVDSLRRD